MGLDLDALQTPFGSRVERNRKGSERESRTRLEEGEKKGSAIKE